MRRPGRRSVRHGCDRAVARASAVSPSAHSAWITPVVLWSGEESDHLKPNPDEVASIHTVSFKELASPSAPQFEEIPESDRKVLSMRLSVDQIYAPTAAFLYQFREVGILGKHTRVLHYDQPRFAWK